MPRSLVFLPPPTLSQFNPNPGPNPSRHATILQFNLPSSSRTPLGILADETRILNNNDAVEQVPDSVDPQNPLVDGEEESPASILAEETRVQDQHDVSQVPDSVDPQIPLFAAADEEGEEEESIARSEVPEAPKGVPWEVLHPTEANVYRVGDGGRGVGGIGRSAKRVRIRSPVLVIETPERLAPLRQLIRRGSAEREVYEDVGDKSRVVLGDESESEGGEHSIDSISDRRADPASAEKQVSLSQHGAVEEGEADKSRVNLGDGSDDEEADTSMDSVAGGNALTGLPAIVSTPSQPLAPAENHRPTAHITLDEADISRSKQSAPQPGPAAHETSRPNTTFDISLIKPHQPTLAPVLNHTTLPLEDDEASASSLLIRAPLVKPLPILAPALDRSASFAGDDASASSLAIRPPVPARNISFTDDASTSSLAIRAPVPAQTCRFTFFSKRPRTSTSIIGGDGASLPSFVVDPPEASSAVNADSVDASMAPSNPLPLPVEDARAKTTGDGGVEEETSIRQTLPTMNAHNASLALSSIQDCISESSLGTHSILPPPTLYFSLASITPLSRILAHPTHFLSSAPRPRFGSDTLGAVSSKVNLLVVVKEVGEVMRVRNKFPVDHPAPNKVRGNLLLGGGAARAEMRGRMSSAFAEALMHQQQQAAAGGITDGGDGKTERVELVVMDGRMSSIKRLREGSGSSGELVVVEEAAEKCLFKVVLWGKLAREWTTESSTPPRYDVSIRDRTSELDGENSTGDSLLNQNHNNRFVATSTNPTALRPGDVISLTNLTLTRSQPLNNTGVDSPYNTSTIFSKRTRLRTGFPRPHHTAEKMTLVAQATAANNTTIELCYRTDVVDKLKDGGRNFDVEVANFDLKSRRVLELSRLWKTGNAHF